MTMKCEDYRQAIMTDRTLMRAGSAAHLIRCPSCRGFGEEVRSLDDRIRAALAISVPPLALPDLPLIDGAVPRTVAMRRTRSESATVVGWLGIAAAFAAAAVLGTRLLTQDVNVPALSSQLIAHMEHEQASRRITSVGVPQRELATVAGASIRSMDTGDNLVTYARTCIINDRPVPHLVVQGESGPVTLILMPEEPIDDAVSLAGENVHGVIIPVGKGSIAVIGDRPAQLREIDRIGERLRDSVTWRI